MAIANIIQEYNKQKEENEELKKLANNKQWISPCYVAQNYIPKSLVEENLKRLEKYFNEVVNIPNTRELIDQLIEYEKTKAKIEVYRELLKGDK